MRKYDTAIKIAIFFFPLLIYAQVYFSNYGYVDAYSYLNSARIGNNDIFIWAIGGDRIFSGVITNYLFKVFDTVNQLKYIRFISVFFISVFGLILYKNITLCGYSRKSAALFSIVSVCVPAFQIYASWSVLVGAPISAILVVIASFRFLKSTGLKLIYERTALVWFSLLFYQPTAMIFFALLPVIIYSKLKSDQPAIIKFSFFYLLSGFLGMVFAYLTTYINPFLGVTTSARASLVQNILSKLHWFILGPLINSTNILMFNNRFYFLCIIILIMSFLMIKDKNTRNIKYITSYFYVIPLSYAPNLLVNGDWASNRTTIGLQILWCGVLLIFINFLYDTYKINKSIIIPIAFFIGILTEKNINEEYIIPNSIELSYASHVIRKINPNNGSVVCVKTNKWYGSLAKYTSFDDFGRSSFNADWSAANAFADISYEIYPRRNIKYIIYNKYNKKICNYTIRTSSISSYRTFTSHLYSIGSNK